MMRIPMRIACVVMAMALILPAVASAQTEAELRRRIETLKGESRRAGQAFDKAYWSLDETDVRIARVDKRMKRATRELKAAKVRLNRHAESIYRREALEFLDFLVGASTYEELVTRFDYLARIGVADADVVREIKELQQELRESRAELKKQRGARAADLKRLKSRRDRLQSQLAKNEAEFRKVKARLDAVRSGGSVPRGVAAVAGPNGMVFPVVGSYYYADTWGASRSGGRRRHQGTDIMARTGTPLVAILPGTVRSGNNGLGGRTIWLRADNGWSFYYAHLNTIIVGSGRVRAGQVIGTVGYSGNASASAPHLHLQIHPGGGAPVNPYPYLRQME
jgi:murein DD-endopeptidase MepM/ murein hydrolase activator NlpD